MSADYSQIEMRIMAHVSEDQGLIDAFNSGMDFHSVTASRVFSVEPAAVTQEQRAKIKAMNYGLAYGLSAYGLSQQLKIGVDEAKGLMDEYFEGFGGVRDYLRSIVLEAGKSGYTETILGRRRYLPDLTSDNRQRREMAERMALNAPIQGSAADVIKMAMLKVDASLQDVRTEVADAAAGPRRTGLRDRPGRARGPGRAGPPRHGRRRRHGRPTGRLSRRRPHLARSRPLAPQNGVLGRVPAVEDGLQGALVSAVPEVGAKFLDMAHGVPQRLRIASAETRQQREQRLGRLTR